MIFEASNTRFRLGLSVNLVFKNLIEKIETKISKSKKVKCFFRAPKQKYCRGFERAQPFGRFGHFRVIFEYFKAILEHLIGNIYIQLEGPRGSLLV